LAAWRLAGNLLIHYQFATLYKNNMTYADLAKMTVAERDAFFRSLPLETLFRLAGDAALEQLDEAREIPGLDLTGLEATMVAHDAAKAETAALMTQFTLKG
jgi:hypothetical protein